MFIAVQLKFIPSPNIGVYQLAHYQCSVDYIVEDILVTNKNMVPIISTESLSDYINYIGCVLSYI